MSALDSRLERLLRRAGDGARGLADSPAESPAEPPPERVNVFIQFTGEVEELLALGLSSPALIEHPREGYRLAAGTVPLARVAEIAALPGVQRIELGQTLRPELNNSVSDIQADDVHDDLGLTGAGVIVGVIDTGLDLRHESFRDEAGKTRVLFVWDQTRQPDVTGGIDEHSPEEYPDLGVELTKEVIDSALEQTGGSDPLRLLGTDDAHGHGTHVAGIAAGNGRPSGACFGIGAYTGVAPEADLIIVRTKGNRPEAMGDAVDMTRAVHYVFRKAVALGRPAVVNISQGDNMGPHDGTSLLELWIDLLLDERPGRAVVKSAGNEGTSGHHAKGTVKPGQPLELEFELEPGSTGEKEFELWYAGAERLSVQVTVPTGLGIAFPQTPVVLPGTHPAPHVANPVVPANRQILVDIASELADPRNGDNRIALSVASKVSLPLGPWKVKLENLGANDVEIHAWAEHGESGAKFIGAEVDDDYLITIPGTAKRVITVANYTAKAVGTLSVGDRVKYSSRGPARGTPPRKPDIAAPGLMIVAPRSHPEKSAQCCDCCVTLFVPKSGTSMAAPHVAGVVALMFQKNPGLEAEQILQILTTNKRDHKNGTGYDRGYGNGLVDALKAVNAVPAPTPIAGALPAEGGKRTKKPPKPAKKGGAAPASAAPITELSAARLREIQSRLLETPAGRTYAALVSTRFDEARALIDGNRRVAVAWHRAGGPAWVRAVLESAADPARPLPEETGPLGRFLDALARHGSPALAADVERHRAALLALGGTSLDQFLERLRAGRQPSGEPGRAEAA